MCVCVCVCVCVKRDINTRIHCKTRMFTAAPLFSLFFIFFLNFYLFLTALGLFAGLGGLL